MNALERLYVPGSVAKRTRQSMICRNFCNESDLSSALLLGWIA